MNEIKHINPKAIGIPTKSYSQGVLVPCGTKSLLFVTGQLPQDSEGNVVAIGGVKGQAEQVFSRISLILTEAGFTLDDVVKVQIFVKDMHDGKIISGVRGAAFKNSRPASTFVEVSGLVKENCALEVEVIAAKDN